MRFGAQNYREVFGNATILIVDDDEDNGILLSRMLNQVGCQRVHQITDVDHLSEACFEFEPEVILLDYQLPGTNGLTVLRDLWAKGGYLASIPVIMLTANASDEVRKQAFELGVSDFLYKGFDSTELVVRVRNVLHSARLHHRVSRQVNVLEATVRMRTGELENARREVLERLAVAAEYRDDQTGEHTRRVGQLAGKIANEMSLNQEFVESIQAAAKLHDLGKIGIPDRVLLKPGPLTADETAIIQEHPEIGASILDGCTEPVLAMAREIALTHHERWDGAGYPYGLCGEGIPLSGRIVAVADAFDAMISPRPYKAAVHELEARHRITLATASQFDPQVVRAFLSLRAAVVA